MSKDNFELKVSNNNVSWDAKSDLKLVDENKKKFDKERENYIKEIEKLKANGAGVHFINEIKVTEFAKLPTDYMYTYTPRYLKIDIQKLQEILKTKFSKFSDIKMHRDQYRYSYTSNYFLLTGINNVSNSIWFKGNFNEYDHHGDLSEEDEDFIKRSTYSISNSQEEYDGTGIGYLTLSNCVYLPGFDTFSSDVKFVLVHILCSWQSEPKWLFTSHDYITDDGSLSDNGSDLNIFPYQYREEDSTSAQDLADLYLKFQECLSLVDGIE